MVIRFADIALRGHTFSIHGGANKRRLLVVSSTRAGRVPGGRLIWGRKGTRPRRVCISTATRFLRVEIQRRDISGS